MLCTARRKTLAAQNRTTRLRLERHAVGLAALIADYFEPLAFRSATSLLRAAKICAARVTARFAALRMTQSALAIIILLSFSKWEGVSALGAIDFQVWHDCLPRKAILRVCLLVGKFTAAREACTGI
jgi:hypothetical protein